MDKGKSVMTDEEKQMSDLEQEDHTPQSEPAESVVCEDAPEKTLPDEVIELISALESEKTELKDQLLRTMAEMENLRTRTKREKEDAARYAPQRLVVDLLEVMDNLQRAVQSVPADAVAGSDQLKTLLDGVNMTNRAFIQAFEKHGITEVAALGQRLDPHHHEALFEVLDPDSPAGTVVQVIQPGFKLHDRLLRPARVGVAKGGSTSPETASEKVDTHV